MTRKSLHSVLPDNYELSLSRLQAFQAVNLMTTLIFSIVQRKINKWMRTH